MPLPSGNTAITTVGNATLPAAALLSYITRSGPTGAFTDTTDTAANILIACGAGHAPIGMTWLCRYINTTAYVATLAAGVGVTLTANTGATLAIPADAVADILLQVLSSTTVSALVLLRAATE